MLFRLIEIAVIFFVAMVVITQIMVPVLSGKVMFPFFNKEGELEAELAKANQEKSDAALAKTIQEVKSSAK